MENISGDIKTCRTNPNFALCFCGLSKVSVLGVELLLTLRAWLFRGCKKIYITHIRP